MEKRNHHLRGFSNILRWDAYATHCLAKRDHTVCNFFRASHDAALKAARMLNHLHSGKCQYNRQHIWKIKNDTIGNTLDDVVDDKLQDTRLLLIWLEFVWQCLSQKYSRNVPYVKYCHKMYNLQDTISLQMAFRTVQLIRLGYSRLDSPNLQICLYNVLWIVHSAYDICIPVC